MNGVQRRSPLKIVILSAAKNLLYRPQKQILRVAQDDML